MVTVFGCERGAAANETGYCIMHGNDFETGGWQPKRKEKRAFTFLYLLIVIGIALLAILTILLSRHLYLYGQTVMTASETSDAQPRHGNLAGTDALDANELATPAPVETLNTDHNRKDDSDYLVLVNSRHPLANDYEPDHLVPLDSIVNSDIMTLKDDTMLGEKAAVEALDQMLSDAAKEEYSNWQISDAYRSISVQQEIWDNTYQKYLNENGLSPAKALQATERRVAVPGCSEHHTGLAFDLSIPGESFRLTEQCAWIAQNCWKYGFIVRYAEDKERITGISAEPWHIRFVGEKDAAEIYKNNLCLEEYLE